jgi:predicted deacylase
VLTLELSAPGGHHGALTVPHSHDRSAYGQVVVPLVALVGAPGPTVLLSGGVHGDEGEGPLALLALAARLDPAALSGTAIIAPAMNPLALSASARCTPDDRGNLARAFPGDIAGSVTARLAAAIDGTLLPRVEAVLDLHSGGRTLDFLPCALARMPDDPALGARVKNLATSLGLPRAVLAERPEAGGTLVAAALARGIPACATEIGGGGGVTPGSVALAEAAAENFLRAMGLLAGASLPPCRVLRALDGGILRAPSRGLFRPAFALGDAVRAGDLAGWLHDAGRPERAPEVLRFTVDGEVVARGVGVMVQAGDALAQVVGK